MNTSTVSLSVELTDMTGDPTFKQRRRATAWTVAIVLLVHASLLGWGALRNSPTWDEVNFLPVGIGHWQLGTYSVLRGNPPLVRMVAAIPVLFAGPKTDWRNLGESEDYRNIQIGRDFMAANGERSFWLYSVARWECIPFSLLGGWVCFRWARELYGKRAGLLALALWCFSPNVLGHGQLMTPDVAATAFGAAALYSFWCWLNRPRWDRALVAGVVLGLAELTKMTWIVLFGLLPVMWLAWPSERPQECPRRWRLREAMQLGAIVLVSLYVVNLAYGFDGSFRKLRDFRFISESLGGTDAVASVAGNRFAHTFLGRLPVPVPADYLLGLDMLLRATVETTQPAFLLGGWREEGAWYYYLCGLAIKVPLGTWSLAALAVVLRIQACRRAPLLRDELVLMIPALTVLLLFSSQTSLNKHLRYVLPACPLALIWISQMAAPVPARRRVVSVLARVALVWSVGSSLWIYPHTLSYFNEIARGPKGGPNYMLGSNVEWGQDLLYLKRWLDRHPEARPLKFAYYLPLIDPRTAGIEYTLPPAGPDDLARREPNPMDLGPKPGWYAVSINKLRSRTREYRYLLHFDPVAMAGYSIYIYHIDLDRANAVRTRLGLPRLN